MEAIQTKEDILNTARKLGLTEEEYYKIVDVLDRTPNFTELSIFSVMWSEHCSYKNSIKWLKTLPRESSKMLVGAGEENAGLVDIGNGLGCCFKIESHNHPSAVEPYQGAATGVGGINRDIFTMGARPIAQLNSLRFGNINTEKTRWLVKGVVKGIGDYGNSFGVPTVGGEVYFEDCYQENPLVNAMSVGIVKEGNTASAIAEGKGNPIFIVGSATGKDGIHGATFASGDITEDSANDLPAVQVGDPFQEKLLLEASLEVIKTGAVVGMQDMGAAGITCSTTEMAAKGKCGMKIFLDKVPTRQDNMKAWEILLSESQERMLVVVKKGKEDVVKAVFDKWDLHCTCIGEVTDSERVEYYINDELIANVPPYDLVLGGGAPVYERECEEPEYIAIVNAFNVSDIPVPANLKEVAVMLLQHPNIASRNWIYKQYDSMVGTVNMSTNRPSDAAIVNLKGSEKALAVTVDCNGRYVFSDPYKGAQIAVAEAARNIVCSGAEPLAVTNNLNFGNPYNKNVYWQFVQAVKGMGDACRKFDTPVTGGNVSFYNQSTIGNKTEPVYPTPTIGMIGLLEKEDQTTIPFKNIDDMIYLIGTSNNDIACSQYVTSFHQIKYSPAPNFDLEEEYHMQKILLKAIKNKFILSAHDVSDGGLFVSLTECAVSSGLGFEVSADINIRKDAFWFGESQSRVVVSVSQEKKDVFETFLKDQNQDFYLLGKVTSKGICVDNNTWFGLDEVKELYDNSLSKYLN